MPGRTTKATGSKKDQLQAISGPRVPEFVHTKLDDLMREIRPLGHPRAFQEDVVGALIDAANAQDAADALTAYNPKLGEALNQLEPVVRPRRKKS